MTAYAEVTARLRAAGCVFAEDEARLLLASGATDERLAQMVAERVAGRPLEQVLGWAEFCALRVRLLPGVFVPRQRSAALVAAALRLRRTSGVVLDLCCGSGALGLAIATSAPATEVWAVDVDERAVECARLNLAAVGGTVLRGRLFDPLPDSLRGAVGLIVAVPPYVPTDEIALMPPEARDHEPRAALDGGSDGLDVLRALAGEAGGWLATGGAVLVEVAEHQAAGAVSAFEAAGLRARVERDDEVGSTVVVALRAGKRLGAGRTGR
jgi:release factor glutamine methyltransferase